MSYQRFARGNRRDYERYAHERDDPESRRPKADRNEPDLLDAQRLSRDARRTMQSQIPLRPDESNAEYRYQYEYEQASYMEIYSHSTSHSVGQALQPAAAQHVPDWRLQPLSLTVGSEIARQFQWKAETGTIYTYEHGLTYRYIHLDRITRQFCDQQRNPLSADRALAHAMPQPGELSANEPVVIEASEIQAAQPLPAPEIPAQPVYSGGQAFSGQALVGQWKATSAVQESSELSVGSFVRRADMEAQESHERFTASAVRFLQQELPPGTGALVRIYRKLTMKASQIRAEEPRVRQVLAPQVETVQPVRTATMHEAAVQATPTQAAQLYAESAPLYAEQAPITPRPLQQADGRRELNVAAFTRRAA